MVKGVIPINKPQGWTSFDVCNKLKHIIKGEKIGHLGTLDPMATGVLLVTVGKATKLFDIMQEKTKTYIATYEFGYETDSLDVTGRMIANTSNVPQRVDIENILPKFLGNIKQIPPKYSAKMVNGVRAYSLAQNDKEFELKPCDVMIYSLKIIDFSGNRLTLEISCGSGTYIRALGRDIAIEVGSLATMTSLVRTKIDQFEVEKCFSILDIDNSNINSSIIKINDVLNYPICCFDGEQTKKILNGMTLITEKKDGLYKLNNSVDTVAIVKICNNKAKMLIFLG